MVTDQNSPTEPIPTIPCSQIGALGTAASPASSAVTRQQHQPGPVEALDVREVPDNPAGATQQRRGAGSARMINPSQSMTP